jgi:hypothetical protein
LKNYFVKKLENRSFNAQKNHLFSEPKIYLNLFSPKTPIPGHKNSSLQNFFVKNGGAPEAFFYPKISFFGTPKSLKELIIEKKGVFHKKASVDPPFLTKKFGIGPIKCQKKRANLTHKITVWQI